MDIIQLKYFQAVAQEMHFTRAAEKLNITQPALSISISRLEKEVGTRLFDRVGKKIVLNKCGQIFLDGTEAILQTYESMLQELDNYNNSSGQPLKVATLSLFSHAPAINRFQMLYPDVHVQLEFVLADGIATALHANNVDFIISNLPYSSDSVQSYVVADSPLFLAVSRNHRLANAASFVLMDTLSERLATEAKGTGFYTLTENMYKRARLPRPNITGTMLTDLPLRVKEGYISFVAESFIQSGIFDSNVVFIPTSDPLCRRRLYLLRNKNKLMTPAKEAFLEFMLQWDFDKYEKKN